MSKAFVQRPAPAFTATTVFAGGEFKDISLSDYLGQWCVLFRVASYTFVLFFGLPDFTNSGQLSLNMQTQG